MGAGRGHHGGEDLEVLLRPGMPGDAQDLLPITA
jgi:hypothetical protein